jgi:hypothetical protein
MLEYLLVGLGCVLWSGQAGVRYWWCKRDEGDNCLLALQDVTMILAKARRVYAFCMHFLVFNQRRRSRHLLEQRELRWNRLQKKFTAIFSSFNLKVEIGIANSRKRIPAGCSNGMHEPLMLHEPGSHVLRRVSKKI